MLILGPINFFWYTDDINTIRINVFLLHLDNIIRRIVRIVLGFALI